MVCDGTRATIQASLAPTEAQRRDLHQRIGQCEAAMRPAGADEIGREVAGLLLAFPSAALSETTAKVRARAYHVALEGIPLWALQAAGRKWLRGEGEGNTLDFAPSPPRLRKMANAESLVVCEHLVQLRRLEGATVEREISEAERARVADLARQTLRVMGNLGGGA